MIALLVALVMVAATAAADGAAAAKGGVWMTKDPYCGGLHLAQRPKLFYLTCDPTAFVEKVSWSSWGGSQAKGTGTLNLAELKHAPNVAEAPRVTYKATIVASHPIPCGSRRVYRNVVIHYADGGRTEKTELPPPLCPK